MSWRGGENQLRLLLEGLAASGVECHVAVRKGSAAAERLPSLAQVLALDMRGGSDPTAVRRIARYCEENAIDVIDAHTSHGHSLAVLVKMFTKRPALVVHRRVDYRPKGGLINRWKYHSRRIDRYVAISRAIKNVLVDYGIPKERVEVVHSAVPDGGYEAFDRAKEKAALANAFSLDPSIPFIGNAAALTSQKGHAVLVDACRRLKDQGIPFHCFIAGEGELQDDLERQRMALGLDHDVTFLGFITEVPRLLSAVDIYAMPSNFEGLGTILLDAALAGLPIAATTVGGIPEAVSHGETGFLSPMGDADAFAGNLARLLGDEALRKRFGAAGRQRVGREFSVEAMVAGNLAVYRALVSKREGKTQ